MPCELRRIMFDEEEVVNAAFAYCERTRIVLPGTPVARIVLDSDSKRVVTMEFNAVIPGDAGRKITLSAPQMLAALVLFCHQHGIPLPRDAEKAVQYKGDGLVMMIRIDRKIQQRTGAAA